MSEEMDNKFEVILKEIKSSKSVSTVTNPRSDVNEIQDSQPSGSKIILSTRVQEASNNENSGSENDGFPLGASKKKDLKHPSKALYRNESVVDVTILSNEESDEEDYLMVIGANRQLHRQCSQKLYDTIGSHVDQNLSTLTTRPLDPGNQTAHVIEKLANKNSPQSLFHPKNTLTFNGKNEENRKFECFEDLFHTTLKMQPNLIEGMEINHFHAKRRG